MKRIFMEEPEDEIEETMGALIKIGKLAVISLFFSVIS